MQQAQAGLQDIQRGRSLADTWSNRGEQITRGLKRKAPALTWTVGKHQAKRTAKNTSTRTGYFWSVNHGAHRRIFQNAKSHSTAPGPRPVHFAVSNWRDHFWQVHHGALSLDAHLLPIIAPPLHDDETLEATPKDERGNHFWQVGANALSVDVPVCLPGEPRQMDDDHGPSRNAIKRKRR